MSSNMIVKHSDIFTSTPNKFIVLECLDSEIKFVSHSPHRLYILGVAKITQEGIVKVFENYFTSK